jgi:hypothetical protein
MASEMGTWGRTRRVAVCAAVAAGCAPSRAVPLPAREADRVVLRVPRTPGPIALDGDNDDPGWIRAPGPARTGPFALASGAPARPYSDARLLWGDGCLYVLLYAADDDVQAREDAFLLRFSRGGFEYAIDVAADGALVDAARDAHGASDSTWRSGAHVSREIDGTIDDARDDDEEWSIEMAVPLASLGLKGETGEALGFAVERFDASRERARPCGQWGEAGEGGRLVLE